MAAADVVALVRSVLGPRLTDEEADRLVRTTVARLVPAGGFVCQEGDGATGLLLLLTGTVEVLKGGRHGAAERLATIEAPTVLGEMSLFAGGPRTATVRAETPCQLRVLPRAEFHRLLEGGDGAALKLTAAIAQVLARRLARMDQKVVELAARRDCPQPVEELAEFKQKLFSEWRF